MRTSLRALFFSHDRRGLGHIRRTLALADLLLDHVPNSTALVVTGSRMAHAFRTRPRLDYVKLPSITRGADGVLSPSTLDAPLDEILKMREELLLQTTRLFRPDVLLVDSPPLAQNSELAPTLAYLRANVPQTAVVLNLRDILDDPTRVAQLWDQHAVQATMADDYDLILVHGSPRVYDLPEQYRFSDELRAKTFFCGYVRHSYDAVAAEIVRQQICAPDRKLLVVTVGGGADGTLLIERCLAAVSSNTALRNVHTLAILGPDLPIADGAALRERYGGTPNLDLLDFVEPASAYLAAADVIVSMGGYNTLNEIAALRKRAVIVPRVHQSTEQLVRARRFAELGLVQMLHPDEATPAQIATTVVNAFDERPTPGDSLELGDSATFARMVQGIAVSKRGDVECR